jgi:hypothetical protein
MTESRDILNAQFAIADVIKNEIGGFFRGSVAVSVIINALHRAMEPDEFRALQYAIQCKEAPPDPEEEAWYDAWIAAENEAEEKALAWYNG